jgi:serine/threonine protein kinase
VTAYCQRGALSALLYGEQRQEFPQQRLTRFALDAAAGIRHLHAESIVHRDIAARNVFVDHDYTAKVGDFGMSKVDESGDGVSQTTATVIGPLKWMAPEQLNHQKWSFKSDVFSFGVLLYEIFARVPPWADLTPVQAAALVMGGKTLSLSGEFGGVAARCWCFEPHEVRFSPTSAGRYVFTQSLTHSGRR